MNFALFGFLFCSIGLLPSVFLSNQNTHSTGEIDVKNSKLIPAAENLSKKRKTKPSDNLNSVMSSFKHLKITHNLEVPNTKKPESKKKAKKSDKKSRYNTKNLPYFTKEYITKTLPSERKNIIIPNGLEYLRHVRCLLQKAYGDLYKSDSYKPKIFTCISQHDLVMPQQFLVSNPSEGFAVFVLKISQISKGGGEKRLMHRYELIQESKRDTGKNIKYPGYMTLDQKNSHLCAAAILGCHFTGGLLPYSTLKEQEDYLIGYAKYGLEALAYVTEQMHLARLLAKMRASAPTTHNNHLIEHFEGESVREVLGRFTKALKEDDFAIPMDIVDRIRHEAPQRFLPSKILFGDFLNAKFGEKENEIKTKQEQIEEDDEKEGEEKEEGEWEELSSVPPLLMSNGPSFKGFLNGKGKRASNRRNFIETVGMLFPPNFKTTKEAAFCSPIPFKLNSEPTENYEYLVLIDAEEGIENFFCTDIVHFKDEDWIVVDRVEGFKTDLIDALPFIIARRFFTPCMPLIQSASDTVTSGQDLILESLTKKLKFDQS